MSLVDSAVDGLLGALITGVPSLLLLRRARPRRAQYEDAWKQQADELQRLLASEHDTADRQQDQQIKYLRGEIRRKDAEITRIQRVLGRTQGGSTDD